MLTNSSKQRLRLAHQLLDKQLSNNTFGNKNNNYGSNNNNMGNGRQSQITKSRDRSKQRQQQRQKQREKQRERDTSKQKQKNVQSQISQLQRKLLDLEKKMENIDISSSNQDDKDQIIKFVGKKNYNSNGNGIKGFDRIKDIQKKDKQSQKGKNMPRNSKISDRNRKFGDNQSAEEDSEDDGQIYARIQSEKQKKNKLNNFTQNPKKYDQEPKITINKQPLSHAPTNSLKNSTQQNYHQKISKPETPQPIHTSTQKNQLRNSVKSVKSNKSNKSIHSHTSNSNKKQSQHKLQRSLSKKSINSISSLGKGGLSQSQYHQLQIQNAKDNKKISNLQKQLNHYKRLCMKQQQKLQQYRIMQIQYRKLETNFNKSQQIRKQQKKIIESLKNK